MAQGRKVLMGWKKYLQSPPLSSLYVGYSVSPNTHFKQHSSCISLLLMLTVVPNAPLKGLHLINHVLNYVGAYLFGHGKMKWVRRSIYQSWAQNHIEGKVLTLWITDFSSRKASLQRYYRIDTVYIRGRAG